MVARSQSSNQRPDTLMQDRKPTARRKPLATRGRTIHWVKRRPRQAGRFFRGARPPRGGRASDDGRISGLASRVILVDPQGYEGTGEAQHENAGSRYGDQV